MMNIKKPPFIAFAILSLIYLFPIIKADRYFIDDYNRSVLGYLSWSDNGRPLADVVMTMLNFNTTISDISPLTQLMGVASLAIILLLIMQSGSPGIAQSVACALCVLVNPFMLETLSYAYDSLPMLLSIACVCAPFCIHLKNSFFSFIIHFLFILASLCLYQASISIYVIFAIFSYIAKDNKNSDGLKSLITNGVAFISGYIVYSKFIAKYFIAGGYSLIRAEFIDFSTAGAITRFAKNIVKYYDFLMLGFPAPFMLISVSIIVIGILGLVLRSIAFLNGSNIYSRLACLITLTSPIIIILMVLAPLSILANPPVMSRVLASTGVVMMFFMFYAFRVNYKPVKILSSLLVVLFMIYSYSSVYAYGNAQKKQKDFEAYTINLMQSDISRSNIKVIDMYGTAPTSPVSSLIVGHHPLMAWMVLSNITFRDEWRTNITLSNFRFPVKYKSGSFHGDIKNPSCELMLQRYNGLYTLFESDGVMLFYFKDICSN